MGIPGSRTRQEGFSVIELMVTLTIAGILTVVALPSFNEMLKNNRRTVTLNELVANVMLARAEAAKRGQAVTMCGLPSSGVTSCAGGTTWDYGWIVFLDPDADGVPAASTDVLRVYVNDYRSTLSVRSSTGGPGYVVLRPFNQSGTQASLKVCDSRGAAKARVVCVATSGRAVTQETTCNGGAALTCP